MYVITEFGYSPDRHLNPSYWRTQDDVNGIIWVYKVYYENLPIDECLFPDYELEAPPLVGCRPKYPLIFEVKQGHKNAARSIVYGDTDLNVNTKDGLGSTVLHYAVMMGGDFYLSRVVKALVGHKDLKVNAKDAQGQTPLHLAAKLGDFDIVKVLLRHPDINVNSRDVKGYTAAFYATEAGHTEIEDLIRAHKNFDSDLHQSLPKIPADVNGDGIVNIQDLVLVSSHLGETGQNSADVNGDGVVNIQDLVLVASAFENVDER